MLEEKIAAAHGGWSEIPFCLTQDGFHSEISEDQYRIKMEKPEGRRQKGRKALCVCVCACVCIALETADFFFFFFAAAC